MTDLTTRAAALLAAVDKMTRGTFSVGTDNTDEEGSIGIHLDAGTDEWVIADICLDALVDQHANAAGIVALRNDAPALIRELLAENENLRAQVAELELTHASAVAERKRALDDRDIAEAEIERLHNRIAEMYAEQKFADAQRAQLLSVGKELSDEITKLRARVAELEAPKERARAAREAGFVPRPPIPSDEAVDAGPTPFQGRTTDRSRT